MTYTAAMLNGLSIEFDRRMSAAVMPETAPISSDRRTLMSQVSRYAISLAAPGGHFAITTNWKTSALGNVGVLSTIEPKVVRFNTRGERDDLMAFLARIDFSKRGHHAEGVL